MSGYYDDEFDELKGKEILSVRLQNNDDEIVFTTKDGEVKFEAYGDCCSSSYIESLDNPEVFENAVFLSVESEEGKQKEIDENGYSTEVYKWTFYKFKTSKGMCTLSFRNESNGFYDGHLRKVEQ